MTTLWGILLPRDVVDTRWFAVLATFVALNTVMYVALAVAKMLPRIYPSTWFTHRNRRRETRSIHPDAPV